MRGADMRRRAIVGVALCAIAALSAGAQERIRVDADTPESEIVLMDPRRVDASALPLTSVESLHATGTPQEVDLATWRLTVSGRGVVRPLSLTYEELAALPMVRKPILLICPTFFYDYLEWEGVLLQALLDKAGAGEFSRVVFTSVDGYKNNFSSQDIQAGLVMVALKGNGVPLPREHGFPARVVAEGIYGTRWVKYLTSINLE
jgi:DMSO/TMAO reductase YedYZ molybdopterin-dependent catalytic subunit